MTDLIYIEESDQVLALCDQWWIPDRADIDKSRYLFLPSSLRLQYGQGKDGIPGKKWNPLLN